MDGRAELLGYPAFCERTATTFVQHRIDTGDPDRFRGRVTAGRLGDLGMARIASADHAVARTPADIADSAADHYKVSLQVSGTAQLSQDDLQTTLRPGDFVIYDTAHPYRIRFPADYRSVVLMLPKRALPLRARSLREVVGQRLTRNRGVSGCFVALLAELSRTGAELDAIEGDALAGSLVELLGLSLRHELGEVRPENTLDEELRARVLAHIDANLRDPDLGPLAIAAAHHISVSRLHALFRGTGITVAAQVRERRLAACHRALADPRQRGQTLTEIAHQHGLRDSAHFSRLYRARYGLSPRESRRRAA